MDTDTTGYEKNKELLAEMLRAATSREKKKIWKMLEESDNENVTWLKISLFVEYFWQSASAKEKYKHMVKVHEKMVKEGKSKRLKDTIGENGRMYRNYEDIPSNPKDIKVISSFPIVK